MTDKAGQLSPGAIAAAVNAAFGRKLRLARHYRDLSQADLAGLSLLSRVTIANMERGKQNIQLQHLFVFAQVLDIPIQQLLPTAEEIEAQTFVLGQGPVSSDRVHAMILEDARAILTSIKRKSDEHEIANKAVD